MEAAIDFMTPLTAYHWIAIGLLLLGVEMAFGTFDLLWVSIAAFGTALIAVLVPESVLPWQGQLGVFAAASFVLVVLGRTVFAGMRRMVAAHPTLNKRMDSLVGRRGVAATDFSAGLGRVKLGDTEWSAETDGDVVIRAGDAIVVERSRSTTVIVKRG
ncbi:MAG: NfeD family protein [Pseudomonadota bacterium]